MAKSSLEVYNSHCSQCAKLVSKCKPQAYCCWLLLLLIATAQSSGVYSYVYIYVLQILNYAMQSASMDNFVNLIQQLIYLSTVIMGNGERSVPETVSGCLYRTGLQ